MQPFHAGLGLLVAHTLELWVFAVAYFLVDGRANSGELVMGFDMPGTVALDGDLFDCAYYSVTCYSTLGFGEITPVGPIRLPSGTEALVGLLMIAWSASYTYLYMQQHWDED